MKKLIVLAAVVLGAMTASATVVEKDTVNYTGEYKLDKIEKTNEYGEISVRYVCYLLDVTNKKGEPRKVTTDKATYESGAIDAIVYNIQGSGSKRIAKAINTQTKKDDK